MNAEWQGQDTEHNLGALVDKAVNERPRVKLSEFFRNSPLAELDLERDPSPLGPSVEL
jgi:hypothetical protein